MGSPRRQPRVPSTSECRFNKSPHHQIRKAAMPVHSALGACGMHEAVGASRQRRRRWVQSHSRPAAIQALGRRERRFAAPAGPSVARSPVLRAPGAGRVLELVRCARLLLAGLKSACVA